LNKVTLPKENFKLIEISEIEFGTEYRDGDYWLVSYLTYTNGKRTFLFGTKLTNLGGKPGPIENRVTLALPPAEDWEALERQKIKPSNLILRLLGQKPTAE
jgi:hypothetical protein